MKVLIPVIDNNQARNNIAEGFINTDFACIYDIRENSYEWISASEISVYTGNISIELKRKGIYTVISKYIPLMALGLFTDSGLSVYKAQGSNLQENVELYLNNQLRLYTSQMAYGASGCVSSCSSCSSSCN